LKAKLYDKQPAAKGGATGKENVQPNGEGMKTSGKILPSNEVVFSKMSGESDMHLMISRSQEEAYKRITQENHDLKDCLRNLQREMFDIVKLKSDIYMKRFKAENFKADDPLSQQSSEAIIRHEIEKIRESLFSMPFEETGREIIHKFQANF